MSMYTFNTITFTVSTWDENGYTGCSFSINHKQFEVATFKQGSPTTDRNLAGHQTQRDVVSTQRELNAEPWVALQFS